MVDPADAITRPLPHPTKLRFVWHSRFCTAVLNRDLFEQWTVTRSWGIKKGSQGGGRVSVVESFEAGLMLQQMVDTRANGKDMKTLPIIKKRHLALFKNLASCPNVQDAKS